MKSGRTGNLISCFTDGWLAGALEEDSSSVESPQSPSEAKEGSTNGSTKGGGTSGPAASGEDLCEKQRHQLKHRELFLSRQVETLPATHIRGKCTVTLLNETEALLSYLNKDDSFFYSLVYDPQQKTLLADKGEIRVGSKYQADANSVQLLKEGSSVPLAFLSLLAAPSKLLISSCRRE